MNMFKPVDAGSDSEYVENLVDERRKIIEALDELIKKTVPRLKRWYAYNMLGYGKFEYTNYKKEVMQWPVIALASQKNHISIYICAVHDGEYLAEKHKDNLGKVSVGKSCIRFKKLEDLNLPELKLLLKKAADNPGFAYS